LPKVPKIKDLIIILNLMTIPEKNQAMRNTQKYRSETELTIEPGFFLFALTIMIFLLGCTVAPNKLVIKGISNGFEAGTIFSAKTGAVVSFEALLEDLETSRVVYVGEVHTNPAHHRIQLDVIKALFQKHPNLAVGMEMFDYSYQAVLDQWSAGELEERDFLRKVHWYANWKFDFSLYRDILNCIKLNHIRLVGLNIPFCIPPKIRVGGLENLSAEDKEYLPAEIDTSNTAHRQYLEEVFKHHFFNSHVEFEDFYMAQLIWEETMAESIARNLDNDTMVVLAGDGHIQFKYGIPDRVCKRIDLPYRTIYLAPAPNELEPDIADYIWVTE